MSNKTPGPPESPLGGEILLFQSDEGHTKIQVRIEGQTVWLSQRLIAELYQVSVKTVNEHLVNIYEEGELASEATIWKFCIWRVSNGFKQLQWRD